MSRVDKSTSTPTTPSTPTPPNVTKLCHIIKRADFDGYGFNLHSEKIKPGQFIGKVDPHSPAEEAGLKEGDRIIEVNGVAIGSETHKQVVQRIKALANEVRLLLIDVDGKGDVPKTPTKITASTTCSSKEVQKEDKPALPASSPPSTPATTNGNESLEYQGTKLELPGESANISSISVVSTKRMSNASSMSNNSSTMSADVVDKAMPGSPQHIRTNPEPLKLQLPDLTNGIIEKEVSPVAMNNNNMNTNNNNKMSPVTPPAAAVETVKMSNVPPPPSTITATNNNNSNNNGSIPTTNGNTNNNITTAISSQQSPKSPTSPTATPIPNSPTPSNGVIRAGSLNLPMTAAEMRAKLMSKKKYDPKQETVDLRKKFEIIQKL